MAKFILVHDAKDASPVVINSDNIIYIEKSEVLTGASYVQLNDTDMEVQSCGFHVTETPEKIYEMLK